MRLHTFITQNQDAILIDWVAFARELQPSPGQLDDWALLDHGKVILAEIASDMQKPQSATEQQEKSEGHGSTSASPYIPSRSHARQRKSQGFNIVELVAEYRALRATVLRLWSKASSNIQGSALEEVTRFNEAVDQAITESLQAFTAEIDKSRDLLLGVLGHDLRGPLSTIENIATADLRTNMSSSRNAAVILRSVAQMKALLDDLVEYARHRRSSGFQIEPQELHLGEFARNTLEEIAAVRDGPLVRWEAKGDLYGAWDARRMHQALSNLVFNALKYGDPGAPIGITLDGTSMDDVVLTVQNTGKPIPPASLASLFDPFVRGDAQAKSENFRCAGANLGLGLYVVLEITKAHGGTVEVVSNDAFTRFLMRLPRKQKSALTGSQSAEML